MKIIKGTFWQLDDKDKEDPSDNFWTGFWAGTLCFTIFVILLGILYWNMLPFGHGSFH